MTVAFTGYRPEKMPFIESKSDENYMRFRKRQLQVIERLIERGCTDFISGVAMGFDIWAAEDVLSLQKKNKALTLECAIPFNGQADGWDKDYQKRRYKLLHCPLTSCICCRSTGIRRTKVRRTCTDLNTIGFQHKGSALIFPHIPSCSACLHSCQ